MGMKRIVKFVGLGIIITILGIISVFGFIMYDVVSYTATSSQTLNPAGTPVGNALVVYDPGISGDPKNAASAIASNLQAKGYKVDLAGIRSSVASNTTGYKIIIVGGPIYVGNASNSVRSYLNTLKPPEGATVAVFATGEDKDILNNSKMIKNQVAPLDKDSQVKIIAVTKFISGEDTNKTAMEFVNGLLEKS